MHKKTQVINPRYILERDNGFFLNSMCIRGFCQTYIRTYFYPKEIYESLSIRVCLKRRK